MYMLKICSGSIWLQEKLSKSLMRSIKRIKVIKYKSMIQKGLKQLGYKFEENKILRRYLNKMVRLIFNNLHVHIYIQ